MKVLKSVIKMEIYGLIDSLRDGPIVVCSD